MLHWAKNSTLYFCQRNYVIQMHRQDFCLYFSSLSQLPPSRLRRGCLPCLHLQAWMHRLFWLELSRQVFSVRRSFLHTLCGCRHVILLETTGPMRIFFLLPFTLHSVFESGIYIHPILWFYENIHVQSVVKCCSPGSVKDKRMSWAEGCLAFSQSMTDSNKITLGI